jgi:SAM-dependent methyltransferase
MQGLVDAALSNPWATLDRVLDGPLHPGGRDATEALLDRAGVDAGTTVLDVGCGAGDALELARERGATAWGVDPDPGTDRAVRGDATRLPLGDGSVDVVLAECVLCLTGLEAALAEADRVLAAGGRLAVSDVVVSEDAPEVPDRLARALCLTGARPRAALTDAVEAAGFTVASTRDHREDLLAMRDRVAERVDYRGLLATMGERGQRALSAVDDLEAAVEDGRIGYVSVVARR